MKLLDALLGRTKAKQADLDALFALPACAITLETAAGLHSARAAAVCFKAAEGQAFAEAQTELRELLNLDKQEGLELSESDDRYGYHWVVLRGAELEDLVSHVHTVNSTLQDRGFSSQLLASAFAFADGSGADVYLVYLYKRGTFYPFAPTGDERRNTELELRLRGAVQGELPVEADLSRWFPIWGVPIP